MRTFILNPLQPFHSKPQKLGQDFSDHGSNCDSVLALTFFSYRSKKNYDFSPKFSWHVHGHFEWRDIF
jgi:hypothetical protein